MANDGRIYITISNKPLGEGNGGEGKKKDDKDIKVSALTHQVNNFLINNAKNILNYSINNIGNFTGDFNAQRQAQNMGNFISDVTNIGIAFARFGVVGGGIALATTGINFALQEHSNMMAIRKQNYQIDQLRAISGLNTLTNGSR